MKTVEENLETVDEMFCEMVLDTFLKMKEITTGNKKFVFYRKANSFGKKSFLKDDVYWICYDRLDDRIKYAVDVLSTSDNYVNDNVLFL